MRRNRERERMSRGARGSGKTTERKKEPKRKKRVNRNKGKRERKEKECYCGGKSDTTLSSSTSPYKSKNIVLPLLSTLTDLSSKHRTFMLAHLDDKSLRTLCNAVDKVLHARLPNLIKTNLKRGLAQSKNVLRKLCCHERLNTNTMRRHLMRMGGGPMRLVLKSAMPLYSQCG